MGKRILLCIFCDAYFFYLLVCSQQPSENNNSYGYLTIYIYIRPNSKEFPALSTPNTWVSRQKDAELIDF